MNESAILESLRWAEIVPGQRVMRGVETVAAAAIALMAGGAVLRLALTILGA